MGKKSIMNGQVEVNVGLGPGEWRGFKSLNPSLHVALRAFKISSFYKAQAPSLCLSWIRSQQGSRLSLRIFIPKTLCHRGTSRRHEYMYLPKVIEVYTQNKYILLCVNYTPISWFFFKCIRGLTRILVTVKAGWCIHHSFYVFLSTSGNVWKFP